MVSLRFKTHQAYNLQVMIGPDGCPCSIRYDSDGIFSFNLSLGLKVWAVVITRFIMAPIVPKWDVSICNYASISAPA